MNRILVILVVLFFCFTTNTLYAQEEPVDESPVVMPSDDGQNSDPAIKAPNCKAAAVMEVSSGELIYQYNANEPLPPASMVKLMSIYIAMEKLANETIHLDDILKVSANASKMGGSQVYLREGEEFTLEQLLKAVIIQSANDASMAIAEYIGGNSQGFVDLMNEKAKELGMKNSHFSSPHGLPPAQDQSPDLVSAADFAILARAMILHYPKVLEWSSIEQENFRDGKFQMTNTNRLLRKFPGCDGLKTGFYQKAGFCVTATAERKGIRVISVVMGCEKGKERFEEAARLMSWGFNQFKKLDLIAKGTPAKNPIPIINGVKKEIFPVTVSDLQAVIPLGKEKEVMIKTTMVKELTAPVAPNTECGTIAFILNDREIGSVKLASNEEIPKLGFWGRIMRMIGLD